MAKPRTKKRTHIRVNDAATGPSKTGATNRTPKSMVIRMGAGEVGSSVSQLVKDVRAMMEPDTASRLKVRIAFSTFFKSNEQLLNSAHTQERRSNKLKDFTSMAGPLGVTHFMLFSRSKSNRTNLRIALTPRGPTLHFQIEKYSLCKDIAKAQKHPRGGGKEFISPPLLVMNNFSTPQTAESDPKPVLKQLESLTTTIFQSMFPPISPQNTPLSSIRRIMLLNRETTEEGTYVLNLRHYAITTRRTGISKRIRRLDPAEQRQREKKGHAMPDLGRLEDVADYLLDPAAGGYTSASETELDTDAEVEVLETGTRKIMSRKEILRRGAGSDKIRQKSGRNVEKRAVKLVELGPRIKMRMVKVEEGVCEGRVMWHEFVTKSKAEEKELESKWTKRREEKEQRKKVQKENVQRKKELRKNTRVNGGDVDGDDEGGEEEDGEGDDDDEMDDSWDSEDEEDVDGGDEQMGD
jgi:ribosome biogenesis protein SSF1/2